MFLYKTWNYWPRTCNRRSPYDGFSVLPAGNYYLSWLTWVCPFVCPSLCPSIHFSVRLSISLSVYLFPCPSIYSYAKRLLSCHAEWRFNNERSVTDEEHPTSSSSASSRFLCLRWPLLTHSLFVLVPPSFSFLLLNFAFFLNNFYLFICLSLLIYVYLSPFLSISVCISECVYVCVSVCLSIYIHIYRVTHLLIYQSIS